MHATGRGITDKLNSPCLLRAYSPKQAINFKREYLSELPIRRVFPKYSNFIQDHKVNKVDKSDLYKRALINRFESL